MGSDERAVAAPARVTSIVRGPATIGSTKTVVKATTGRRRSPASAVRSHPGRSSYFIKGMTVLVRGNRCLSHRFPRTGSAHGRDVLGQEVSA
jgi:hypothetical protein